MTKLFHALADIHEWFSRANSTHSGTKMERLRVQMGVHFEEVSEMLAAVDSPNPDLSDALIRAQVALEDVAGRLKTEAVTIFPIRKSGEEVLDALCDQIVTAIGTAVCFDMNILGALDEVSRSNWSKFDDEGTPIRNDHGKIIKGPNYSPPHLGPYL
jgi:predicted HAD superfamily Cof-like phosphohydrolase